MALSAGNCSCHQEMVYNIFKTLSKSSVNISIIAWIEHIQHIDKESL